MSKCDTILRASAALWWNKAALLHSRRIDWVTSTVAKFKDKEHTYISLQSSKQLIAIPWYKQANLRVMPNYHGNGLNKDRLCLLEHLCAEHVTAKEPELTVENGDNQDDGTRAGSPCTYGSHLQYLGTWVNPMLFAPILHCLPMALVVVMIDNHLQDTKCFLKVF